MLVRKVPAKNKETKTKKRTTPKTKQRKEAAFKRRKQEHRMLWPAKKQPPGAFVFRSQASTIALLCEGRGGTNDSSSQTGPRPGLAIARRAAGSPLHNSNTTLDTRGILPQHLNRHHTAHIHTCKTTRSSNDNKRRQKGKPATQYSETKKRTKTEQ